MVMADRNDFGGISTPMHAQTGTPAVFIYDGLPGGAGLCRAAFPELEKLFLAVRDLLRRCPCETGCPSCVHSPKCGSGNRPIDKAGALFLLERLVTEPKPLHPLGISGLQAETSHGQTNAENVRAAALPVAGRNPDDAGTPHQDNAPQPASPVALRPPLPARYMVLDVETRRSAAEVGGWNRADRMGVSIAVLYDAGDDVFLTYEQDELPELFRRLQEADVVVGFNSLRFDYAVLQPFAPYPLRDLPTLDMLAEIKRPPFLPHFSGQSRQGDARRPQKRRRPAGPALVEGRQYRRHSRILPPRMWKLRGIFTCTDMKTAICCLPTRLDSQSAFPWTGSTPSPETAHNARTLSSRVR